MIDNTNWFWFADAHTFYWKLLAMDQERAKKLFDYGATFVFLDVPEGSEFGMDCNVWSVGPNFKGVKMIPPGLHFIHFSPVSRSTDGDVGHRSGFFYDFKAEEIVLRFWNKEEETMRLAPGQQPYEDDSQSTSFIVDDSRKKELDPYLAPYPYDNHKKWISLTNHATFELAKALSPEAGLISSYSELVAEESFCQKHVHRKNKMEADEEEKKFQSGESNSKETKEAASANDSTKTDPEDRLPKMKSVAGTPMRFHAIPIKSLIPPGATPAEVTRLSLDKTPLFERILTRDFQGSLDGLLGELQLAFVIFLYGRLFDGFEQWKRLTHLLCSSAATAAGRHPHLYADFITVLFFQTKEIPEDFFLDIVTRENFLTSTLCSLFVHVGEAEDPAVDANLKTKAEKFKMYLTKKFKWNFDEDDLDDESPVVVELTESQRQMIQ